MSEPIVCLGGAFDPVHNGHLIVARAVAERCGFTRVTLIPTARPPHKPETTASAADRLAMLQAAIDGDDLFEISDVELRRGGPSYTLDTLAELRRENGPDARIVWIIGADMLAYLPKWHRAGEVVDSAEFVVAARTPESDRLDAVFDRLGDALGVKRARRLRDGVVETPRIDISSTDIRRRVGERRSIRYLVGETVRAIITERGLYLR